MQRDWRGIAVSVAVHSLLLAMLFGLKFREAVAPTMVEVASQTLEMEQEDAFTDTAMDDAPARTVTASPTAAAASGAAARMEATTNAKQFEAAAARALSTDLVRPLMSNEAKNMNLASPIEGNVGTNVGGASDSGAVDRITREIRRALESGRVLVCWVLDSTVSMRERREKILSRFGRVYDELDKMGVTREKALLTGVMTYGQKNQFLTKEPTSDVPQLLKLLKAIKDDDSGTENVFTAVRQVCQEYRKFQTTERRQLMVIVLTDENGDDPQLVDDAIVACKRAKAPVYVLGPAAPFGRDKMMMPYKIENETFMVPVDRGPESIQIEHLNLPFWGRGDQYDLFSSGFGPYHLTRMVRETGGLYFIDDNDIKGPRFSPEDMREYRPDYVPVKQYLEMLSKTPLRRAVLEAAQTCKGAQGEPPVMFANENINPRLTQAQGVVAKTESAVARALAGLRDVEKLREKETSKRWQAHYDLMMGRLLATKVRCSEYNWALAQMKVNNKTPKEKNMNAWRLAGDKDISFGKKEVADTKKAETNVKKSDPKATAKAKEDADKALTYLQRVVREHGDTPWGKMAERELQVPLGFKWVEAYIPPPPKPGQPMTAEQRADQERQKRRAELMKKVPKSL